MKHFLRSIFLVVSLYSNVYAQKTDTVKYFKSGGFASLAFNQVSLNNWSAGGESAIATTAILNLFGNYKKENIGWDNSLDLGYGLLKNGSDKIRKNEDKIEFNSKFGYQAFDHVYYSVLVNFRSQFSKGFKYPNDSVAVSRFMAPGYLSLGLGLDYKPNVHFSFYFSPVTGRITFVSDQQLANSGAYGVDPAEIQNGVMIKKGKRVRAEFGANISTQVQVDLIKDVHLVSKLMLFNNYTDKAVGNRKNIDVNWESMINIKAGKLLTTSILTNLIYDQNVIARTQFKESLGIGLSYKF